MRRGISYFTLKRLWVGVVFGVIIITLGGSTWTRAEEEVSSKLDAGEIQDDIPF